MEGVILDFAEHTEMEGQLSHHSSHAGLSPCVPMPHTSFHHRRRQTSPSLHDDGDANKSSIAATFPLRPGAMDIVMPKRLLVLLSSSTTFFLRRRVVIVTRVYG